MQPRFFWVLKTFDQSPLITYKSQHDYILCCISSSSAVLGIWKITGSSIVQKMYSVKKSNWQKRYVNVTRISPVCLWTHGLASISVASYFPLVAKWNTEHVFGMFASLLPASFFSFLHQGDRDQKCVKHNSVLTLLHMPIPHSFCSSESGSPGKLNPPCPLTYRLFI